MPIGSICVVNPAYRLSVLISKKIVLLVFLVVYKKKVRGCQIVFIVFIVFLF